MLTKQDRKYWHEVLFENGILGAIANDGLLAMFELKDVEQWLKLYPQENKVWFFNETKDREIAELRGTRIIANPQFMWRHLGPIAIEESINLVKELDV